MAKFNIKVFGVGGGGSNTIDYIQESAVSHVTTYAINTDAQALNSSKAQHKIHIGEVSTKGLGAGALPEIGRRAAEESRDTLIKAIDGAHIVFVAAGMGGGTGTGAAPYIASLAKELGILTIVIVTKPFAFEGSSRMAMALEGIHSLEKASDVTVVIPNEKLIANHRDKYIEDAFILPDNVVRTGVEAIVGLLVSVSSYTSNIDLNTLVNRLTDCGLAVLGMGTSCDDQKNELENVAIALTQAINSDILEVSIEGAREFIIQIAGDQTNATLDEQDLPSYLLQDYLGYDIRCTVSTHQDSTLGKNGRRVTMIASNYKEREHVGKIVQPPVSTPIADGMFRGL